MVLNKPSKKIKILSIIVLIVLCVALLGVKILSSNGIENNNDTRNNNKIKDVESGNVILIEGKGEDNVGSVDNEENNLNINKNENIIEGKKTQEKFVLYKNNYIGMSISYSNKWYVEEKLQDYFDIISKLGGKSKLSEVTIKDKIPIVQFNNKDEGLWVIVSLNDKFYHDRNIVEKSINGVKVLDYFGEKYDYVIFKKVVGRGNNIVVVAYKKDKLLEKDKDCVIKLLNSIKVY